MTDNPIDLGAIADTVHRKLQMIETAPTYDAAEDAPTPIMPNLRKMLAEQARRDIPPVMSEPMYDVYMPVTAAIGGPTVLNGGWCAPTEAERWQWLTDDERAAEIAEARAAADCHGHDYIVVGGMTMPHPPTSVGLGSFAPVPVAADGMWDVPSLSVKFDPEVFQAHVAEARKRIGEILEPVGVALSNLGPVFAKLADQFASIVYITDGTPPPPAVDAATALAALAYAETTEVLRRPRKRDRADAKRHYLAVKRHLDPVHRPRLRKVPMRQFGALS